MRRKRVPSYLRRAQSRSHHHPLRFSGQTYVRPHVISSRKMQSAPTVHCTGQCEEKAPQRKSLQSLIFTQSGRRDLNPRPPEPHSGALPDCATSRELLVYSQPSHVNRRTAVVCLEDTGPTVPFPINRKPKPAARLAPVRLSG